MKALVTGAVGQDGYYLCRQLLERGYAIYGLYRGQDEARLEAVRAEYGETRWVRGDITDAACMNHVIATLKPDFVFNMAALTFVGNSWLTPTLYMDTNCNGLVNVLEACRLHVPEAHIVQASTSEMFGNIGGEQHENSPMIPASPYGVSKLAAHRMVGVYRESYGVHVSAAISFNHESPRRPPIFVTRKVTQAAARGLPVTLGNLDSMRDWGFAGDYADAYIRMAEADKPGDYVIGTGKAHSIRDLCKVAYGHAGLDYEDFVSTSEEFKRPNDLTYLRADATRVRDKLGWQASMDFETLVRTMVDADSPSRGPLDSNAYFSAWNRVKA